MERGVSILKKALWLISLFEQHLVCVQTQLKSSPRMTQ